MKSKADFTFIIDEETRIIAIEDLNKGNISVTNDMENILNEILVQGLNKDKNFSLDNYTIVYKDSNNVWDGVNIKNNKFFGFFPISALSYEEAVKQVNSKKPKFEVVRHSIAKKIESAKLETFKHDDDPICIHVLKSGFNDKYFVLEEDAYTEQLTCQVLSKKQIEDKFKFQISI